MGAEFCQSLLRKFLILIDIFLFLRIAVERSISDTCIYLMAWMICRCKILPPSFSIRLLRECRFYV
uniref:Uncharacterized protein n=1 Tax=Rhizophora mucronata TaxID=61149 RepID=A0A2P2PTI5_RHIMU